MLAGARILLTGATGRLGRCVAEELVHAGCEIVVLVRAPSREAARDRAREALAPGVLHRTTAVRGDVVEQGLGLGLRDRRHARSVDAIVHAAATTSFSLPLAEARASNVAATRNVLAFAEGVTNLSRHVHVSTAFVAGRRIGRVLEDELQHDRGFLNTYQQSKHEAELLVRRRAADLPLVVVRPSIVLDGPGSIQRRSAFRFAFELVRRGLVPALPGTAATPVDLVTEDDAARAIARLLFAPEAGGTYHVAGGDLAPTLGDLVDPYGVRYVEEEQFGWELTKWAHERPRLASAFRELESFIPELAYPKVFDTSRVEALLDGPVRTQDPVGALLGEPPGVAAGAHAR